MTNIEDESLGDFWRAIRACRQEKKRENLKSSIEILIDNVVDYKKLSDDHYRVGDYDFWPSTGLFIHMRTKKRGRGVFKLLNLIKVVK